MDTMTVEEKPQKPKKRRLIKDRTKLGEMFQIHLKNYFLTIITLGIYRFWAKTHMRRYLWSHVEFQGSRFEYTGTPKELFLGFLVIFFVFLVPIYIAPNVYFELNPDQITPELLGTIGGLQTLLFFALVPIALFRARRYRLTRTRWRAIAGGQSGSAFKFGALTWLYRYILTPLTFSLIWPWASKKLTQYKLDHTWVGSQQPHFYAKAGPLYKKFLVAILMFVLVAIGSVILMYGTTAALLTQTSEPKASTFMYIGFAAYFLILLQGVIFAWYKAAETMYFLECTTLGELRFITSKKASRFAWATIKATIIGLLTLGLGMPWVYKIYLQFFEKNFRTIGDLDVAALTQSPLERPKVGEGLADAIDVGAI